jgi:hypothetical protein
MRLNVGELYVELNGNILNSNGLDKGKDARFHFEKGLSLGEAACIMPYPRDWLEDLFRKLLLLALTVQKPEDSPDIKKIREGLAEIKRGIPSVYEHLDSLGFIKHINAESGSPPEFFLVPLIAFFGGFLIGYIIGRYNSD